MEEAVLFKRHVICDRPIAVTYEITEFGKTALGFLAEFKHGSEANNI